LVLNSVRRRAFICSTATVWRYNDQDPIQFPIQPLLTPDVIFMCDCRRSFVLDI
jgi:hypothetical protein